MTLQTRWHAKHEEIVQAAERVFLERGYARASMGAIADEAGASKQTLYHHYGSKEKLFGAVVDARTEQLLTTLRTGDLDAAHPREALTTLARAVIESAVSPASVALYRAVLTEAPRQPELGRVTYERGGRNALTVLAHYLDAQRDKGRLRISDTAIAAEQFFGMILGFMQVRALLGVETAPPADRMERAVTAAVETFLAAYGAPPER